MRTKGLLWALLLLMGHGALSKMVSRCPEGWVHQSSSGQCFRIHSYGKLRKFSDARSYCKGHGGDLAIIEDVDTKNWLSLAVAETGLVGDNAFMWVGAKLVDGQWKWVENDDPVNSAVIEWEDEGASGDCAAFTINSKLTKYDCVNRLHFICHRPINVPPPCNFETGWEQLRNLCYLKSSEPEPWHNGRLQCRLEGGDLITITSSVDQQYATDFALEQHDNIWIGLSEEDHPGKWTWSDGSDNNYTHWDKDQPESMDGFGAAVINHEQTDGKWVVEKLTEDYHYLCQKKQGACVAGWEEFGNSCYYFNTEEDDMVVWDDAKTTCEAVGARLVVLDTLAEDEYFRAHMPETDQLWIGLYSNPGDGFYWVDESSMQDKNFTFVSDENIEDAINSDVKKCSFFQIKESDSRTTLHSSWIPTDCATKNHYACEIPAGDSLTLLPPPELKYCPEGWVNNLEHCYLFSFEEKSWASAQSECQNGGGDLVSILTWGEQDYVSNNMMGNGWIGLNDRQTEDVWVWSDNSKVSITNWNDGEPNGNAGNENCGEMRADTGKWNDLPCHLARVFTCKRKASATPIAPVEPTTTPYPDYSGCGWDWTENPVSGECYRLELIELSFEDARHHCMELYHSEGQSRPELLSLTTAQEQSFIEEMIREQHLSQTTLFIGLLNDVDGERWIDGTPMIFFNWNDGEPSGGYEECGEMYVDSGKWNDVLCSERRAFVCEKKGTNYVGPVEPPPPEVRCPNGWKYWDNHCYYFGLESKSWSDSRSWCQANLGSDLASITSEDENTYINSVLANQYVNAWIGLHDNDAGEEWHWMDGANFGYTNWMDGEPNNQDGLEHCGEIRSSDYYYSGMWNDMPCDLLNAFVCKTTVKTCPESWTLYNGKCYYASNFEATWNVARDLCKEFNTEADLVSIHSQDESDFFGDVLTHSSLGTWIGFTYDAETGQWAWSDGQPVNYTNWNDGEPNNLDGEACTEIIDAVGWDTHTKWNNMPCTDSRAFGCEFFPTHTVGCEEGWQAFNNYCYWYSNGDYSYISNSFNEARDDCRSKGGDLVSIHSQEENEFVYSLVGEDYYYTSAWIGLSDEGHSSELTWVDNTPVTFTNYKQFGYDPIMYDPSCGVYDLYQYESAVWDISSCSDYNYYICKKPQEARPINPPSKDCRDNDVAYKGSCYMFPGLTHSWQDAKGVCEASDSHLVALNDRFESAFLSSYLSELGERAWIGMSGAIAEDGSVTFDWVTGEPVTFTNWAEYEPAPNHGTCVAASGRLETPGLWEIRECTDNFQYVCEYDREGYIPPTPPTTPAPTTYCADGWERHAGKCYKVFPEPRTWGMAEGMCNSYGAFLTSIGSAEEQVFLQSLPGIVGISGDYLSIWVGLFLSSDAVYYWTDGSAVDYVDWAPDQPDSHLGREGCVLVDKVTFKMSDSVCDTFQPFICEAAEGTMVTTQAPPTQTPDVPCDDDSSWLLFNDHCYKFISEADETPQTWWTSHRRCRDEGGELASIHSYEENYWIMSKIYNKSDQTLWIGGRAKLDSGYEWLDGSVFDFVNWAQGEPNNFLDQEDCISMYTRTTGYWNDQNCAHNEGRICKRPHHATLPPAQTTAVPEGHCQSGWLHVGSKCFKFFSERLSFDNARNACQALGSDVDMISVHSAIEQAHLTTALGQTQVNTWLGMRNERGFHWVDQTAITYTNWAPGEPNGHYYGPWGSNEDCVEMLTHNSAGQWNDANCQIRHAYICQRNMDPSIGTHSPPPTCAPPLDNYLNYSGSCYKIVSTPTSWQDAEDACVSEGAHLASVQHVSEQSFLWVFAVDSSTQDMWIGLNNLKDKEQFRWSDDWPTIYTNWAKNEPNSSYTDHNCVRLSATQEGSWFSELCSEKKPYVCKHKDGPVPTPDPPATGTCPDGRWLNLGGGYCYLVVESAKPWNEANMRCVQENADLTSIHSQQEMDLITMATHKFRDPLWIGLVQKTNGYGWSDGTGFDYVNWQDGEPNSESEQCAEFYPGSGNWNDAECSNTRAFICKILKIQDNQHTEPTLNPPPQQSTWKPGPNSLNAGGIVGIVIAVLFVVAGVGFVGVTYMRRKPKPVSNNGAYSFDNALYSESYDGAGTVTVGGSSATSVNLENPTFDTDA
ncbi:macrophage mannose receptor 1-like isoform X1 [Penaeus japonicus]|uniref:macrophage mannose receptor 1-like isoform X1 n=1 Tax=Penaeus japonicus TaxID=27405 RepID=UPI001C710DCE|nr:macrophage mannose receptor 1-like isoform X1 [Penaeus japonicus]XP_042869528.1 macrophage mannose receptor 1-like isoform X1 [Penaeus japonicus]